MSKPHGLGSMHAVNIDYVITSREQDYNRHRFNVNVYFYLRWQIFLFILYLNTWENKLHSVKIKFTKTCKYILVLTHIYK